MVGWLLRRFAHGQDAAANWAAKRFAQYMGFLATFDFVLSTALLIMCGDEVIANMHSSLTTRPSTAAPASPKSSTANSGTKKSKGFPMLI